MHYNTMIFVYLYACCLVALQCKQVADKIYYDFLWEVEILFYLVYIAINWSNGRHKPAMMPVWIVCYSTPCKTFNTIFLTSDVTAHSDCSHCIFVFVYVLTVVNHWLYVVLHLDRIHLKNPQIISITDISMHIMYRR